MHDFCLQSNFLKKYSDTIFFQLNIKKKNESVHYCRVFTDYTENSRFVKKMQGMVLPFRLVKLIRLNNFDVIDMFYTKFGSGRNCLFFKEHSLSFFLY
jgi:hypothetical protein